MGLMDECLLDFLEDFNSRDMYTYTLIANSQANCSS